MFRRFTTTLLLLSLCGLAQADTVTNSGVIEDTDPAFNFAANSQAGDTFYDAVSFTVDADGTYAFLGVYPGDTAADENMDGYLILSDDGFSSGNVGTDDDYSAGGIAALAAFDGACVGSNCSAFEAALTAGTTYTMTQTSFTNVANSFGQPTGPYDQTWTGPGNFSIVPAPSADLLGLVGFAGVLLCMARRRK